MLIERDRSLEFLNTFRIAARAKLFAEIHNASDLEILRQDAACRAERWFVLGGGSNVLFRGDFDGLIVKNSIPGIVVLEETQDEVVVRAGAGEEWHPFVRQCV